MAFLVGLVFDTFVELMRQEVETVVSWVSGRAVGEGKEGQGKGGGEGAQGKARTSTGPAHSAKWGRAVGEARKAREGIDCKEARQGREVEPRAKPGHPHPPSTGPAHQAK